MPYLACAPATSSTDPGLAAGPLGVLERAGRTDELCLSLTRLLTQPHGTPARHSAVASRTMEYGPLVMFTNETRETAHSRQGGSVPTMAGVPRSGRALSSACPSPDV